MNPHDDDDDDDDGDKNDDDEDDDNHLSHRQRPNVLSWSGPQAPGKPHASIFTPDRSSS